ncbi:hypothetical protein JCM3775_001615 [Rhodotorula graminis]
MIKGLLDPPPISHPEWGHKDKVASSTPTRPLETPPYALVPLLHPVFASSRPTSPPPPPPAAAPSSPPPVSRIGQLVSSVAAAASSTSSATSTSPAAQASVRTVEAAAHHVWLGTSHGSVRLYSVASQHGDDQDRHAPSIERVLSPGPSSPPTTPRRSSKQHQVSALELVDEVTVTPAKKPADRIALLARLDKCLVLSEGVLTFHALPALAPLNVHAFPSVRGVSTFALDEDELAGRGAPDAMHVCVFKRRTVHWLRITNDGISSVKDLPLRSGALVSVFRRGRACVADAENYSIVDLQAAEALPLLPISQSPHPDPLPPSTTSSSAPSSTTTSSSSVLTPTSAPGPDPRQRPAIACVADGEFLIASHTGSTTLGVFVNEVGEPCRGTLEWASNLRSLVIDGQYSVALLHNHTVEIHSIHSQEIVQVVQLSTLSSIPSSPSLSSSSTSTSTSTSTTPSTSNPSAHALAFEPRALVRSSEGLELDGKATGRWKTEWCEVPLRAGASAGRSSSASSPPRTPTKRQAPSGSGSGSASAQRASRTSGRSSATRTGSAVSTRILVTGRNALYALSPLTLVVQVDALLERGRAEDARALVDGWARSARGGAVENAELSYVYHRLALVALSQTDFARAFDLVLLAGCDPRVVVRLFADLREGALMRGERDAVWVPRGVEDEVKAGKGIDEYILDNLNRNYSPHLKPDVESASTTVGLRNELRTEARDALGSYLARWRARRRGGEGDEGREGEGQGAGADAAARGGALGSEGDSRKVDMVVDTTLVRLFAEQHRPDDIRVLLAGPNDCVLAEVEGALHDAGMHALLAGVLKERGETGRVLDIWTRIVDGEYSDPTFSDGVHKVFDLVWRSKDKGLIEKYGLWLLRHDVDRALRLFTDPKQPVLLDTRDLFGKMVKVDSDAADRFLEVTVLQERDSDAGLHADLVKRYIGRLGELLADPEAKAHLREQETAYAALAESTSTSTTDSTPTFLSFLVSRYSASVSNADGNGAAPAHALLDRVRLKAILFLGHSTQYDVQSAKADLEEIEIKGMRGLTLERVIVYGKLGLDRQALSLVLHSLHDLSTAETYALQCGDPLVASDVRAASSLLGLVFSRRAPRHGGGPEAEHARQERREALARLVVDMCVARPDVASEAQVARLLETQAVHLDTLEVLTGLPDPMPLSLLGEYLSRSLRRSLHSSQEAAILKALAEGQNLEVQQRALDAQEKCAPVVQLGEEGAGVGRGRGGGGAGAGAKELVLVEGKEVRGGRGASGLEKRGTGARDDEDDAVELDLR